MMRGVDGCANSFLNLKEFVGEWHKAKAILWDGESDLVVVNVFG